MKIDLITVIPSIAFEVKKSDWGKTIDDPDACDDLIYRDYRIISYKKISNSSKIIEDRFYKYINEVNDKIIDAAENKLIDYAIIINKNLEVDSFTPPNPDSQHLLTYLFYLKHLDSWINLDFIKILCFKGGGRHISINNIDEHFSPKYFYLLPIEQNHKAKLKIHKKQEKLILDILSDISRKNKEQYKRIITSISLFNESCRLKNFNPNSSIVLLVSSLEALLELPRWSKKETFSYAIKLLWGLDSRIMEWALQLYELRSQIVHGDFVEGEKLLASEDRHYPHFEIGRNMYHDCLLFILEINGLITLDKNYKIGRIKDLRNKVISNKEKVDSLLKISKKYTFTTFLKNKKLYKDFILKIEDLTLTDHSAEKATHKLLNKILTISEGWMEYLENNKKIGDDKRLLEYYEFRTEKFKNIQKIINDIRNLKQSQKGFFDRIDKVRELKEEVRQLGPFMHKKEDFHFTITEFLERCLYPFIWSI